MVDLVKVWLADRSYYVSLDGTNSILFDLLLGTVQGSILGPILYAIFVSPIFVSPIFEIKDRFAFADDTFIPRIGNNMDVLIEVMERSMEKIITWMKHSGLKINENKTEICVFHKSNVAPIRIRIGNEFIYSKDSINVLGVLFDTKLSWSLHVRTAVIKAARALNAMKLIRKYFNTKELLQLITSNYYSILFYNSEVWHTHNLKQTDKSKLLTASSSALNMAIHYTKPFISYKRLHVITNRATPDMFCNYKLSLLLYKTYNMNLPLEEWINLNFNQTIMRRQTKFHISKTNNLRVGLNILCNRFHSINDIIPLDWLNKSYASYKIECKKTFQAHN